MIVSTQLIILRSTLADDRLRTSSYAVISPLALAQLGRLDTASHLGAVGVDVRLNVAERPAVTGQAEPRAEALELSRLERNSATGIRRPAVVEVERDAAEQVVAAQQQPPLRLEEHDVRRARDRASRARDQVPASVSTSTPGDQLTIGLTTPAMPGLGPFAPPPSAAAAPAAHRSGARPRSVARATAPDRPPPASCARAGDASTARSPRRRRSAPPSRSGPSAHGCRPAA